MAIRLVKMLRIGLSHVDDETRNTFRQSERPMEDPHYLNALDNVSLAKRWR